MRIFAIVWLTLLSFCAFAGYQEGEDAYHQNRYSDAVHELQPLAENGNVEAQYLLGLIYANEGNKDVPGDIENSAYWFRKAADQGHEAAKEKLPLVQMLVGDAYYLGENGKTQSYSKAAPWLLQSAEAGNAESQFLTGLMYANGNYYLRDDEKAFYWFREAAKQGHENSMTTLGFSYLEGTGVPQDFKQALYWYGKAANRGYGDGLLGLGNMYFNGQGVNQDFVIAYMFWKLADSHESEDAKNNLAVLDNKLTNKQFAEAESLSIQWKVGKPFPTKSKTWKKPQPVKASNASAKLKLCAPPKREFSYSDDCINGDCVRTFSNGCQKRFQASYCYDAMQSQWTWKPDGC